MSTAPIFAVRERRRSGVIKLLREDAERLRQHDADQFALAQRFTSMPSFHDPLLLLGQGVLLPSLHPVLH